MTTRRNPEKGSALPSTDHALRYIKPTHIDNGVINGQGFLPRSGENAPSANWMEWFDPPPDNQVASIRRISRIKYARTGYLVALNVGQTLKFVRDNSTIPAAIKFMHMPLVETNGLPADPSHCEIQGFSEVSPSEAALLGDLMVQCAIRPYYPAS